MLAGPGDTKRAKGKNLRLQGILSCIATHNVAFMQQMRHEWIGPAQATEDVRKLRILQVGPNVFPGRALWRAHPFRSFPSEGAGGKGSRGTCLYNFSGWCTRP